jgi:hypothetical protein
MDLKKRVDVCLLGKYPFLMKQNIEKVVQSKQSLRKGYDLVKCGGVWDLWALESQEDCVIEKWIISEKTIAVLYKSFVSFSSSTLLQHTCTCKGVVTLSTKKIQLYKHFVAILVALDGLRNYSQNMTPKTFHRPSLNRYRLAPQRMKDKIDYSLTWQNILIRLSSECPKKRLYTSGYYKFISEKPLTKKEKKEKKQAKPLPIRLLDKLSKTELVKKCIKRNIEHRGKKKMDLISLLELFFQPSIMVGFIDVIDPMEDNIFSTVIKPVVIESTIINMNILESVEKDKGLNDNELYNTFLPLMNNVDIKFEEVYGKKRSYFSTFFDNIDNGGKGKRKKITKINIDV